MSCDVLGLGYLCRRETPEDPKVIMAIFGNKSHQITQLGKFGQLPFQTARCKASSDERPSSTRPQHNDTTWAKQMRHGFLGEKTSWESHECAKWGFKFNIYKYIYISILEWLQWIKKSCVVTVQHSACYRSRVSLSITYPSQPGGWARAQTWVRARANVSNPDSAIFSWQGQSLGQGPKTQRYQESFEARKDWSWVHLMWELAWNWQRKEQIKVSSWWVKMLCQNSLGAIWRHLWKCPSPPHHQG